ncbi:hypothetical protein BaRGS_00030951 [Batillaria attramentaria]|uniref:Uncharacterized protein n=1 Tax=Batillaria attramentaria TaxID=370345 RepID=A0ABD0JSE5_9CAEN
MASRRINPATEPLTEDLVQVHEACRPEGVRSLQTLRVPDVSVAAWIRWPGVSAHDRSHCDFWLVVKPVQPVTEPLWTLYWLWAHNEALQRELTLPKGSPVY